MPIKNSSSNEITMLCILNRSLNKPTVIESKVVSEFHYGLFIRKEFVPKFKLKSLEDIYAYLSNLVSIQGFKNVDDLLEFLIDLDKRASILVAKYENADILDKLKIEQGFSHIYNEEAFAAECKPEKSFFSKITEQKDFITQVKIGQKQKRSKPEHKTQKAKNNPLLQSSL